MKRVLLTISYDGTNYHGWQIQPNAVTVQQILQEGLFKVLGKNTGATGCSRTDAGVHAREFCCHIDCDDNIPKEAFLKGLNSVLPRDISVLSVKDVENDFHARYCAKGKTYVYNIFNSCVKDPFALRYAWSIEKPLDVELMNEFCKKIVGTHDFYGFSSSGRTVEDTIRTVSECFVTKENDLVKLQITANGFLYNMVRIITGTAVDVAFSRIEISQIDDVFNEKCREKAGITAPPNGLFLEKVIY